MNQEKTAMVEALSRLEQHPGNPWQNELQLLRARIRAGEDISGEVIDLLSSNENVLRWFREEMQACLVEGFRKDYEPLPGDIGSISASVCWVCKRSGCNESLPVIREGEDAPACSVHRVPMIRKIR